MPPLDPQRATVANCCTSHNGEPQVHQWSPSNSPQVLCRWSAASSSLSNANTHHTMYLNTDSTVASSHLPQAVSECSAGGAPHSHPSRDDRDQPRHTRTVQVERRIVIPLAMTETNHGIPALSAEAKKASTALLKEFEARDKAKRALEKARNELESYIVNTCLLYTSPSPRD